MRNETIGGDAPSSAAYEGLEAFVRQKVQGFIQEVLEEEVTALLGRRRWQRRRGVDEVPGYRNGYGRLRKLSLTSGTVEVRRPRVRGLEERFESRILPLFKRRTREVGELLPQLYLHGLAEGDFDLALRGLLGEGGAAVGIVHRAAEGGVAGRVRGVQEEVAAGTQRSSTCGLTASTSRRAWRRRRRRYWWP